MGGVLALVATERTGEQALHRAARQVIRLAPTASLVVGVRAAELDPERARRLRRAVGLPVVPVDAHPLEPVLRRALTDPHRIGDGFHTWLRLTGVVRDSRLEALLARVVDRAADRSRRLTAGGWTDREAAPAEVRSMARSLGLTPRGLRDLFARNRLPPPVRWKVLARTLVHAVFVQADPRVPLTRVALALGYADSQGLSHAFHQCFGVTPSFVRSRLGWSWLAWRWWERQQAAPGGSTAVSAHANRPRTHHT